MICQIINIKRGAGQKYIERYESIKSQICEMACG